MNTRATPSVRSLPCALMRGAVLVSLALTMACMPPSIRSVSEGSDDAGDWSLDEDGGEDDGGEDVGVPDVAFNDGGWGDEDAIDFFDASEPDPDPEPEPDPDPEPDPEPEPDPDPDPDPEPEPEPTVDPAFEAVMTFTTVNIGRNYPNRAAMETVIDRVGDVIGPKNGPNIFGWQEIGAADPCGASCEIEAVRARFRSEWGWQTRRPMGTRPNGGRERVNVPVTVRGANTLRVRTAYASAGWAGVSSTRFHTVVFLPERNLSVINTHLIAGAWSCKSNVERRKRYWRQAWNVLKDEVEREHQRGRNVIVTGDLNRPRNANGCNPAWDPTSLHPRARIIGGASIDYVFAVPAAGWRFELARRASGEVRRGAVTLGIDSHRAFWVRGRFQHRS
ncbi:hypothetical protein [Lujinxingia vulgaris]|nr:hypothetical protein [Lujinxingia vulgaris]